MQETYAVRNAWEGGRWEIRDSRSREIIAFEVPMTTTVLSNAETRVAVTEEDGKVTYEVGAFKLEEACGISVALAILGDAARRTGSLEAATLHKLLDRSIAEMR